MSALLRDAVRGLRSRRGATAVAVGGLTLALATALLVGLLALALADPDPAIPEPERVVLLDFKGNVPGHATGWLTASPLAFASLLKARQTPLDLISRVGFDGIDFNHEGRLHPAYLLKADADLVPLLGLKALHGDLRAALSQHDGVAITIGLLRKLWGELPPALAIGCRLQSRNPVRGRAACGGLSPGSTTHGCARRAGSAGRGRGHGWRLRAGGRHAAPAPYRTRVAAAAWRRAGGHRAPGGG